MGNFTRAAIELWDSRVPAYFFRIFGRPSRTSVCECERSNDVQLGPVMALVSGPTVGDAISDPGNAIANFQFCGLERRKATEMPK